MLSGLYFGFDKGLTHECNKTLVTRNLSTHLHIRTIDLPRSAPLARSISITLRLLFLTFLTRTRLPSPFRHRKRIARLYLGTRPEMSSESILASEITRAGSTLVRWAGGVWRRSARCRLQCMIAWDRCRIRTGYFLMASQVAKIFEYLLAF